MQSNSNITEAEWQIMKVIWSNNPCTSSLIIKTLNKGKSWAPTTAKTLLARLVSKKIIGFEMDGRTRNYFPLHTELECVYAEMRTVIYKIYGGIINYETEHYEFYGDNKQEYIKSIADKLEENYVRVLDILDYTCDEKFLVYTYSSFQRFQSAMGVHNGPKWMRAGHTWDIIHMCPEECFDNIDAAETAVHVFITLIILKMNRVTPYWLMQGASAYISSWLSYERRYSALVKYRKQLSREHILQISQNYKLFSDGMGYEITYTIAEFIISEYDNKHLVQLIKDPNELESIFECTSNDFWQNWINFLDKTYFG